MKTTPSYTTHTIKLLEQKLTNGCIQPYVRPVLDAAERCAAINPAYRGTARTFPKFIVQVDGKRHEFKQRRSLEKFLTGICIGAVATVFRNAGKGATIQFN